MSHHREGGGEEGGLDTLLITQAPAVPAKVTQFFIEAMPERSTQNRAQRPADQIAECPPEQFPPPAHANPCAGVTRRQRVNNHAIVYEG